MQNLHLSKITVQIFTKFFACKPQTKKLAIGTAKWKLDNWKTDDDILIKSGECLLTIDKPVTKNADENFRPITIRFFLEEHRVRSDDKFAADTYRSNNKTTQFANLLLTLHLLNKY